jgi:hypothetical protein
MPVSTGVLEKLTAKVVWAYKHIDDLDSACDAFIKTYPDRIERQHDTQTREFVFRMRQPPPMKVDISLMVGDALGNLRSALDHTANHLYSGPIPSKKRIYFPIFETAPQYQAAVLAGEIQHFGKPLEDFLDGIKPYKGGNDLFWKLRELNNRDKHRLLLPTASAHYARSQTRIEAEKEREDWARIHPGKPFPLSEGARRMINVANPIKALKAGDEFLRVPDTEVNEHPHLHVDVAINEIGIAQGEPLVPLLREIAGLVMTTIVSACK